MEPAEARIREIDGAMRPLEALLGDRPVAAAPRPPGIAVQASAQPTVGRGDIMAKVVGAIGRHGLEDWRVVDIARECGLSYGQANGAVSNLHTAGRVHRTRAGCYRTIAARVA